jgi:hypothetical protein
LKDDGSSKTDEPGSKTSTPNPQTSPSKEEIVTVYRSVTGQSRVNDKAVGWFRELTVKFGYQPTLDALRRSFEQDGNLGTLLSRTQARLAAEAGERDRKARSERLARANEERRQREQTKGNVNGAFADLIGVLPP